MKGVFLAIALISAAGTLFSGYLSFVELSSVDTCGITILGVPTCVFGCVFFFVVLVLSVIGLKAEG